MATTNIEHTAATKGEEKYEAHDRDTSLQTFHLVDPNTLLHRGEVLVLRARR